MPLLCLALALVAAGALAAPAAAQADDDGDFVARQGGECVEVATIGDGSQPVSEFYDYRYRDRARYASYGTTGLQRTGVSQVFVYDGAEGTSLVFLHDRLGDEAGGGGVSMTLRGLPEDGTWPVMDDRYENRDDRLIRNGSTAQVDWMYAPNRTDGAAFRGLERLGDGEAVRIEPGFGRDSFAHEGRNWPWVSDDLDWAVRYGAGAEQLADVDEDAPLTIERGSCDARSPEASLSAGDGSVAVGEHATLRASVEPAHADVLEYRWDVDGDGDSEAATQEPSHVTRYWQQGTVSPEVAVVTRDGRVDRASTDVDVEGSVGLAARVETAGEPTTVGEPVRLDGSGSVGDVESYEWSFGDGGTATGATVDHAFDEPGSHEVRLTVTAPDGSTAVATERVTVGPSGGGPVAALSAPESVAVGETATLDASGAGSDRELVAYRWDLDADGSDDLRTRGPRLRVAPAAPGSGEVAVTVVDAAGRTDRATASYGVRPAAAGRAGGDGLPRTGWSDADVHVDLERTDDGVAVTVPHGNAGDRVRATAPAAGDEAVALHSVEFELDRTVEDWRVEWRRGGAEDLPGDVAPVYALEPSAAGDVRRVTYTVAVDPERVDAPPEGLGLVERRVAWVAAGGTERSEAGTLRLTTSSDALRPLAVASGVAGSELPGAPGSGTGESGQRVRTLRMADLSANQRELEPGQELVVRATYENTGTASAARDATFTVSGETVAESTVEVAPADRTEVEFAHAFERPGTYTVAVDGEELTVRVVEERQGVGESAGAWTGGTPVVAAAFVGLLLALAAIGRWTVE